MQPIYLEPSEEITSVIDKLSATTDRKVAVVVPKNSTLFQSLVNIKLLQKEAKRLDKEVVLIANSKIGERLAAQVGIQSFASLGVLSAKHKIEIPKPSVPVKAPEPEIIDGIRVNPYRPDQSPEPLVEEPVSEPLPPVTPPETDTAEKEETVESKQDDKAEDTHPTSLPANEPPEEKHDMPDALPPILSSTPVSSYKEPVKIPWKSIIISLVLFLIVAALAAVLLPHAQATVTLPAQAVNKTLVLDVSTSTPSSDTTIAGNLISVDKSSSAPVTATGKKDIGTKATGTITITNKFKDNSGAGKDESFPAGTVATDTKTKQTFTLDTAVTVGKLTYNPNNGQPIYQSQSVKVTAQLPGDSGNISPTTFTIASALPNTTIESTTAFTGGTSKQVTVLSQSDIDTALSALKQQVATDGINEIKAKSSNQEVLDGSIWTDNISAAVDKAANTQTDQATATVSETISLIAFDKSAAEKKLTDELSKNIPQNKELFISTDSPITLSFVKLSDDKKTMTVNVTGAGHIVPKVDQKTLAKLLAGKSKKTGEQLLKDNYGATSVEYSISPSWWIDRLPFLSRSITVKYGFSEEGAKQ